MEKIHFYLNLIKNFEKNENLKEMKEFFKKSVFEESENQKSK